MSTACSAARDVCTMSVRTPVATGVGHCSGGAYHLSDGRWEGGEYT